MQSNLEQRKTASPEDSYVASLYGKGLNKILEKIGEEATEVILAAKDASPKTAASQDALVNECADLFFHTFVALSYLDIPLEEVFKTLAQRQGLSGHAEKAARTTHNKS